MSACIRRLLYLCLLAGLCGLLSGTALARAEDDVFAGNTLNSCLWADWGQSSDAPLQDNGLYLSTRADQPYSSAKVFSQYSISGEFSLEVDVGAAAGFDMPVPATAQADAILGLFVDATSYVNLSLSKVGRQTAVRAYARRGELGVNLGPMPLGEGETATRLRIARTAGKIIMQFKVKGAWQDLGELVEQEERDYLVLLGATTINANRKLSAVFRNFSLAGGTSSYRPYDPVMPAARPDLRLGGVVSDYIVHRIWGDKWRQTDPLQTMVDNGMDWVRVGVTTVSAPPLAATPPADWNKFVYDRPFWSSREVVGQVLKEAAAKGMKLNLFLFLSDKAAHASIQDSPEDWRGLSVAETAQRVQEHARDIAAYYKAQGLTIDLYDIGNEIENGILGFRPGERLPPLPPGVSGLEDPTYMRQNVWATEAVLLKAAIAGIREIDPAAKTVLHIAGLGRSQNDIFVKNFFKAMIDFGVEFDYAGLSQPYADLPWRLDQYTPNCLFNRFQETADYLARLGKATIFSEVSYPRGTPGQQAAPIPGFPFTDEGQRAYVAELLRFARNTASVGGIFYFYPEIYPGVSTSALIQIQYSGLFQENERPVPAMGAFKLARVRDGWWFNSAEPGRGYAVEYSPGTGNFFLSTFIYAPGDRSPLWYVSMCRVSISTCSGKLEQYSNGVTLLGNFKPPASPIPVGDIVLTFPALDRIVMAWPGGGLQLAPFQFNESTNLRPASAIAPETGWWYRPDEPGRGWFIETQLRDDGRNTLFMAGFMYDERGQATWYVSSGAMTTDALYEGSLQRYEGGSPMINGGTYVAPNRVTDHGPVALRFESRSNAELTLPNGRKVPIRRFLF